MQQSLGRKGKPPRSRHIARFPRTPLPRVSFTNLYWECSTTGGLGRRPRHEGLAPDAFRIIARHTKPSSFCVTLCSKLLTVVCVEC